MCQDCYNDYIKKKSIQTKCDTVLFQSSNKSLPTIILTCCQDECDNQAKLVGKVEEEANCSTTHLSPILPKELYKSFVSSPPPVYHPVPDQIDIISALGQAFPHIISKILDYLEPVDLCSLCCSSKTCRSLVMNDPIGGKKRDDHLIALEALKSEVGQENWPIKKTTPEVKAEVRGALGDVKNTQGTQNRIENELVHLEDSHRLTRAGENIEDTPIELRNKRRRIIFNDQVSSTSRECENKAFSAGDKNLDSECDKSDEIKGKGKSKCRKLEATVGSKASKRHLRRL